MTQLFFKKYSLGVMTQRLVGLVIASFFYLFLNFFLFIPQLIKSSDLCPLRKLSSEADNQPSFQLYPAKKVVLLHGLYMKGFTMSYLASQLHNKGYQVYSPTYDTTRKSLKENEARLAELIQKFKGDQPVYYIGHSMGGLMLRYLQADYPELFKDSRVITLGTPHNGAAFAKYQYDKENGRPFNSLMWVFSRFFSINKSWKNGLDGYVPAWNPNIPLLSIAGTKTGFINRLFKVFPKNEPNDSLVAVKETSIPQEQEFQQLHITHLGLLISRRVVQRVLHWFEVPVRTCSFKSR